MSLVGVQLAATTEPSGQALQARHTVSLLAEHREKRYWEELQTVHFVHCVSAKVVQAVEMYSSGRQVEHVSQMTSFTPPHGMLAKRPAEQVEQLVQALSWAVEHKREV